MNGAAFIIPPHGDGGPVVPLRFASTYFAPAEIEITGGCDNGPDCDTQPQRTSRWSSFGVTASPISSSTICRPSEVMGSSSIPASSATATPTNRSRGGSTTLQDRGIRCLLDEEEPLPGHD